MQVSFENLDVEIDNPRRLGKAPAKSDPRLLHAARFMDEQKDPPSKIVLWDKRTPFPKRHFGNIHMGCCTRAKQAAMAMRMERLETRQTPKITDEEVIRVYKDMVPRHGYGVYGDDTGAYELDALNDWRKEEHTFKDTKGRALTIDAFVRVNHADLKAVKNAIALSSNKGIAVCFQLPIAWAYQTNELWDIPEGTAPVGAYMPNSWGGHSMGTEEYDEEGLQLISTWGEPMGKITWRAFSIYCDEAYIVIDKMNYWKKKPVAKQLDLDGIKKAVNQVSSTQIK